MRQGYYAVAKDYIIYRENRTKLRNIRNETDREIIKFRSSNGELVSLYRSQLKGMIQNISHDISSEIDIDFLTKEIESQLFSEIKEDEILNVAILASKSLIELEPAYDVLTSRLLLSKLDTEVFEGRGNFSERNLKAKQYFKIQILRCIQADRIDARMAEFDLDKLSEALDPSRDLFLTI